MRRPVWRMWSSGAFRIAPTQRIRVRVWIQSEWYSFSFAFSFYFLAQLEIQDCIFGLYYALFCRVNVNLV